MQKNKLVPEYDVEKGVILFFMESIRGFQNICGRKAHGLSFDRAERAVSARRACAFLCQYKKRLKGKRMLRGLERRQRGRSAEEQGQRIYGGKTQPRAGREGRAGLSDIRERGEGKEDKTRFFSHKKSPGGQGTCMEWTAAEIPCKKSVFLFELLLLTGDSLACFFMELCFFDRLFFV